MTSASEPIILSSDVVKAFPLHYRALVQHLVNTGRAIIKESSETARNTA
jgi:hypothetical protein